MSEKKQEIELLLRDYMNFLPPGPQEAYVPVGSATGGMIESGWPLTAESVRRMDTDSLTGETYKKLDDALNRLADEEPNLYAAILRIYLREESGHRDVDHLMQKATSHKNILKILERHSEALDKLEEYLSDDELYVRWPHKAPGPRPGQNMEEKHDELFAIFSRFYYEQELPYRQSLTNAVFKLKDYYTRRHADRIIKARMKAKNEEG